MLTKIEGYEDLIDRQVISEYEKKEKNGKVKFINSNEIINRLKKKEKAHA